MRASREMAAQEGDKDQSNNCCFDQRQRYLLKAFYHISKLQAMISALPGRAENSVF
jgi:hypothetical protein